ncbi:hypothetical protein [Paenibacillus harenae]|uniref:hypothetical protein n=1 Tax=Paenibacillus harenae TaxID=306543 RepID=UPI0027912970|nr:hypothetical protein [Paenibacillus harenae]MDQ0062970.1 hypothetical protein [Paenibacillus harenae]
MLAMGVIVYSPMQMMFWYDKPSDWNGEEEIEFWEQIPVTWDESIGISGEIGEVVQDELTPVTENLIRRRLN